MALQWAKASGQALLIVHVIPWSPFSFQTPSENEHRHAQRESEITAAQEQVIAPMAALAEGFDVAIDTMVRHGSPSDELIELAEAHNATHLLVGRTGDSGLRVSVFGSVASRLVQHAPIPVTVVP
jgi:nucleotide-binding universal stress UspA family protein